MATIVGQLAIEMAANVARLRTDMEEAKRVVGGAMEGVQGAVDIAKNALIGMAGAFTADAIISQVTSLIGGLAELDDAAESAGSSVETMSALLGVGVQSGKNLNEVVGIVTALNRAMVSAEADTSKAAIAFKALGLNLTGFSDSGLALQAFAQKLGEFEDGANKSQIAIMALGRSGAAAVPFLKDLADAGAITGKITGEQAAEAEKLEKAFAALRYEATVSKQQLLSEYIPAWAATAKEFREARDAGFGLLDALTLVSGQNKRDQIEAQSKVVADLRDKLNEGAGALRRFFDPGVEERMQAQLNLEERRLNKLVEQANAEEQRRSAVKKSDDQLKELLEKIRQEEEQQRKATEARKAAEEAARKLNDAYFQVLGVQKDYTEKVREYETLLKTGKITQDEYTSAIKRLGESQPVVKQYTEDQAKASKELEAAQKKEHDTLKELAKLYEDAQKPIKDLNTEADNALKKAQDEYAQIGLTKTELGDLTAKRWDEKAALVQQQIEEANTTGALWTEYKALVDIKTKYEETARLIREGSRLTAIQDEAKKAADAYKETSSTIEKSLTDALLRGFEGGKGFAQNLVQSMKNLFNTLILRPVIQAVVQPVAGAITGMLGLTGTANAATGGLNLLSGASNLLSPQGMLGGAWNNLATSGVGQAIGLSMTGGATAANTAAAFGGTDAFIMGAEGALSSSGVLAALPWVGGGLALAAALGAFGGGETRSGSTFGFSRAGASYDSAGGVLGSIWSDDVRGAIGAGQTMFLGGPSGGALGGAQTQAAVAATVSGINDLFDKLGSSARVDEFWGKLESSSAGKGGVFSGGRLTTGGAFGESTWESATSRSLGAGDAIAAFGLDLQQSAIGALQAASDLPDAARALLAGVDAESLTLSAANALLSRIAEIAQPASEMAQALDAALNDPGTQAAVSTEVARLIIVQEDALKVAEESRDTLKAQVTQLAAVAQAITDRLDKIAASTRETVDSLRLQAAAPVAQIAT